MREGKCYDEIPGEVPRWAVGKMKKKIIGPFSENPDFNTHGFDRDFPSASVYSISKQKDVLKICEAAAWECVSMLTLNEWNCLMAWDYHVTEMMAWASLWSYSIPSCVRWVRILKETCRAYTLRNEIVFLSYSFLVHMYEYSFLIVSKWCTCLHINVIFDTLTQFYDAELAQKIY